MCLAELHKANLARPPSWRGAEARKATRNLARPPGRGTCAAGDALAEQALPRKSTRWRSNAGEITHSELPLFDAIGIPTPAAKPRHGRRSLPPLKTPPIGTTVRAKRIPNASPEVIATSPQEDTRAIAARKAVKRARAAAQGAHTLPTSQQPSAPSDEEERRRTEAYEERAAAAAAAKSWLATEGQRVAQLEREERLAVVERARAQGSTEGAAERGKQKESTEVQKQEALDSPAARALEFTVAFGPSWDGGLQERDAATRFVKEVFPSAVVHASCEGFGSVRVLSSSGEELVRVKQRDLYRKYSWPARGEIIAALRDFKRSL